MKPIARRRRIIGMRHRILFISYGSPLVPNSGFSYRAYGVLNWLLQRYDVDVIFQGDASDLVSSQLNAGSGVNIEVVEHKTGFFEYLHAIFAYLPFHNILASNSSMKRSISQAFKNTHYDLIWIHKTWHLDLLKNQSTPIIMDQIAEDSSVWDNLVKNDPRIWAKLFFYVNRWRVMQTYDRYYSWLNGVVCISKDDKERTFSLRPNDNAISIPVGFYESKYSLKLAPKESKYLIFSGTGAVRNQEAVRLFCENILPSLKKAIPGVKLLWIGNVDRNKLIFKPPIEVEFTGYVKDVREYFGAGNIYIAPFSMGEGVKIKIIEALAMGKVIVSTSIGISGVGIETEPFVRVCDDWDGFCNNIVDLFNNQDLPALCAAAADYARMNLTWDRALNPLEKFIDGVISKKA